MIQLEETVERIKDILAQELGERRVMDKHVAEALGISQTTFASMKSRGSVPYVQLLEFCARKRISINWLLYDQSPESLVESTNRYSYVRYYPHVQASAGGGAFDAEESVEHLRIPEPFAERLGGVGQLRHIEAIRVVGDSMEPTFSEGDIVFVDRSKVDFGRSGVFVIHNEYGLHIKRLHRRMDGQVEVHSDNPHYAMLRFPIEALTVIGRVVGSFGEVG